MYVPIVRRVNVERALRADGRNSGHFVQVNTPPLDMANGNILDAADVHRTALLLLAGVFAA